jgi:hypothetical protein
MTNIEKIIFDAKYSVKYMNGNIVISGFNHIDSLFLYETKNEFKDIIEKLVYFDEAEFSEFCFKMKNNI